MDNPFSAGNRLNMLTKAPALPQGWHKVEKGLWRHDNGEESRINPSSMFTNNNFASLKSADSPPGARPPRSQTDQTRQPTAETPASRQRDYGAAGGSLPADALPATRATELPARGAQSASGEGVQWWYMGMDNQQKGPVDAA